MAEQMPPEWGQKIIHATLICGDHRLQGADVPPAELAQTPRLLSVAKPGQ